MPRAGETGGRTGKELMGNRTVRELMGNMVVKELGKRGETGARGAEEEALESGESKEEWLNTGAEAGRNREP